MIDEIDSATNNQVFLDFLAQLRGYYINRNKYATFQSVILAGVCDIKNLKRKLRPDEEHKDNSPWNTHEDNEKNESLLFWRVYDRGSGCVNLYRRFVTSKQILPFAACLLQAALLRWCAGPCKETSC